MAKCKDCLHCSHDGLCMVTGKWTLIDVEHDCRAFVRKAAMSSADTREKLLEDLRRLALEWHEYDGNYMRIYNSVAYAQVKELLDRQAAITEREICEWWRGKEAKHDERIHRISELQRQCDELTAERDEVARAYKERGRIIAELTAERDELKAMLGQCKESYLLAQEERKAAEARAEAFAGEMERLQGVVRVQAESFRGMEQELKAALAEKDGKHGKRKLPKPVKWPRDANGKLVGFGYGGASSITFTRYGYCVDYGDGTAVSGRYGEEARA